MKKYIKKRINKISEFFIIYIFGFCLFRLLGFYSRLILKFRPDDLKKYPLLDFMTGIDPLPILNPSNKENYAVTGTLLLIILEESEENTSEKRYMIVDHYMENGEWNYRRISVEELLETFPAEICEPFLYNFDCFTSKK